MTMTKIFETLSLSLAPESIELLEEQGKKLGLTAAKVAAGIVAEYFYQEGEITPPGVLSYPGSDPNLKDWRWMGFDSKYGSSVIRGSSILEGGMIVEFQMAQRAYLAKGRSDSR
jgi:hypothetical protein